MTRTTQENPAYAAQFEALQTQRRDFEPEPLQTLRRAAYEQFAAVGVPTTRNEEWRYTDVSPLARVEWQPAGAAAGAFTADRAAAAALAGVDSLRLVFVNGRYAPELSLLRPLPKGVRAGSLSAALQAEPDLVTTHLGGLAPVDAQPFTALNTALLEDGAFVYVPRNIVVEEPIHVIYLATGDAGTGVSYPRSLFVAAENSQVTLVETYAGPSGGVYFTNAVTEVFVAPNAVVDHYKVQRESVSAYHIAAMQVEIQRAGNFASHNITLGGALTRNDIGAFLADEGIECTLNGLVMASGRQHVDNHTSIDHARPHCDSHELYKTILDDRATGVFNGKIFVRQDAQKTDAKQTNQNLLLSEEAVMNTKPQLEIYADDVRCTHGATVGQLAEEAIFYLRARGIGLQEAREMLTHAFASDILSRIKVDSVRAGLEALLAPQ